MEICVTEDLEAVLHRQQREQTELSVLTGNEFARSH